ncbi:hypothetical protein ISP15_04550 [Dyella jejuensis]|uniref:Uncharacterized protein n=1 Tax=Dyella jejuensis TaxID=1432009 RepID=A0ABW8JET1_9GAMM
MMSRSKFGVSDYKLARFFLLSATFVSIGLLVARKVGMVIPQPLLWLGWFVIDIKILLTLAELAEFLRTRRKRIQSTRKGKPIRLNPFFSLMFVEVTIFRGFMESWKKHAMPTEGFAFRKGPEYRSMKYALWISFLVEIPFLSFLFYILPILALYRVAIEVGVLFASAYILIAYRSDLYAVKHSAHQLDGDQLTIHMGLRVRGAVPLDCITAIAPVEIGKWRSFARKLTLDGMVVAKVSPLDKPNVVLHVAQNSVELEWIQGNTMWPDYIGLYVDHPHRLIAELRASCPQLDENQLPAA